MSVAQRTARETKKCEACPDLIHTGETYLELTERLPDGSHVRHPRHHRCTPF